MDGLLTLLGAQRALEPWRGEGPHRAWLEALSTRWNKPAIRAFLASRRFFEASRAPGGDDDAASLRACACLRRKTHAALARSRWHRCRRPARSLVHACRLHWCHRGAGCHLAAAPGPVTGWADRADCAGAGRDRLDHDATGRLPGGACRRVGARRHGCAQRRDPVRHAGARADLAARRSLHHLRGAACQRAHRAPCLRGDPAGRAPCAGCSLA